jgi:hypothetical protein
VLRRAAHEERENSTKPESLKNRQRFLSDSGFVLKEFNELQEFKIESGRAGNNSYNTERCPF